MITWLQTIVQLFFNKDWSNQRILQIYSNDAYQNFGTPYAATNWIEWTFITVIFLIATYYTFDIFIIFVKKMLGKKKRKH